MLDNIKLETDLEPKDAFLKRMAIGFMLFIKALIVFTTLRIAYFKYRMQLYKLIKLRHRYIFSRSGKVRMRYAAGFAVMALFMTSVTLRSAYEVASPYFGHNIVIAEAAPLDSNKEGIKYLSANELFGDGMKSRVSESMRMATTIIQKPKKPLNQTLKIGSGDTLAGVLQEAGVEGQDAFQIVKALSKHYDPRGLRAGQMLDVAFKHKGGVEPAEGEEEILEFTKLTMKLSPIKEVVIEKDGDEFASNIQEKELEERDNARYAEINTSLYGSAARAGIPSPIIAEVIRLYSQGVDFQRDLRRGDKVEVLYKTYETADGDFAKYGDLLYANLVIGGKDMPMYRYKLESGTVDYFDAKGQSNKKTLMKTPIDGARISSGFGMRKHPVLGYNKMHKGMDFAAPTGTPIYASGNGTIAFAGRKGGYGNYVQIRHNGSLSTAYAHMHRFAKNIATGKRVKQGEIIGYVGTTGRSTGPHLHYEVLIAGAQVNPNRVDLPTGETLKGKEMKKFQSTIASLQQQYAKLVDRVKVAALDLSKKEDKTIR